MPLVEAAQRAEWDAIVTTRAVRCRMLDHLSNRCPNPALDPDAPLIVCVKHAAAAAELLRHLADMATTKLTKES